MLCLPRQILLFSKVIADVGTSTVESRTAGRESGAADVDSRSTGIRLSFCLFGHTNLINNAESIGLLKKLNGREYFRQYLPSKPTRLVLKTTYCLSQQEVKVI